MQVLYSLGATAAEGAEPDRDALLAELDADWLDADDDQPGDPEAVREAAIDLALAAWQHHADADAVVTRLAPDWPTHRQPPVDRAILRLAHHELASKRVPLKVAINEAIELAKSFGSENSPAFVNGVLDKLAKEAPKGDTPAAPTTGDAWLDDAVSPD